MKRIIAAFRFFHALLHSVPGAHGSLKLIEQRQAVCPKLLRNGKFQRIANTRQGVRKSFRLLDHGTVLLIESRLLLLVRPSLFPLAQGFHIFHFLIEHIEDHACASFVNQERPSSSFCSSFS